MSNEINLPVSAEYIASLNIPKEDFIDVQYDEEYGVELQKILLILSTPRSGSTFLSDLIYQNKFCIPHEYFQVYQYMPILVNRWGCMVDGVLDKEAFVKALIQHRCSENGCLGINLHGSHLSTFIQFMTFLPKVKFSVIHILRKDTIAQAVSYFIASKSKKWSSHFDSQEKVKYSYHGILRRKERIDYQNQQIEQYIRDNDFPYIQCVYEEFVKNPAPILSKIIEKPEEDLVFGSGLMRQASQKNADFIERFMRKYEQNNKGIIHRIWANLHKRP